MGVEVEVMGDTPPDAKKEAFVVVSAPEVKAHPDSEKAEEKK
jgi:hypothetical protein